MRVLVIHRYFWPDTPPYGWMLRAIAGRWTEDGHDVTVLTSQPSYGAAIKNEKQPGSEELDGFQVRRVALFPESKKNFVARVLNLGLFMARIFLHITSRRRGYDVVMAATTPPVMVAWVARIAASLRGSKFVYHCQDIHPELMRYAGLMDDGFAFRFLQKRDNATVNKATRVVVLSTDMQDSLLSRDGTDNPAVAIINNFTVPEYVDIEASSVPQAEKPDGVFRVIFAGNLGYFQGVEAIIDAAKRLREHAGIEFVFLGDGAARQSLIDQAGDMVGKTVHFFGFRPQHEAEDFVRNADLSLITLAPNIIRTAYPSKTMTYLKMGSAILAIVEAESELATLVTEREIGYVASPGDAESIADCVLDAAGSPASILTMRQNALRVCEELFSEASQLSKWSSLLREPDFPAMPQPVFLIGAGRSGTKFVRNLLGQAADAAAVPYDVGYVWRTGNEGVNHDELPVDSLTIKTKRHIRRTLLKLARAQEGTKVLIEKSVPNALRIDFLRAVYPEARFVHLIRDGRAVAESSIRQWSSPADTSYLLQKLRYFPWSNYRYAFWYIRNQLISRFGDRVAVWGPRYKGMDEDASREPLETVCARQWRICVEKSRADLSRLPPDRVMTITYEDLVRDESVVNTLCDFVGLSDKGAVLEYYRDNVQGVALEKWETNLSADQKQSVMNEIEGLLAELRYTT